MDEQRSLWWWVVAAAGVAALLAGGYLYFVDRPADVPVATAPAPEPAPTPAPATTGMPPAATPPIEHPIEAVQPPPAEPVAPELALDDSDATVLTAVGRLSGGARVVDWLQTDAVVRRIVATVDNTPRSTVATKIRAFKAVPGAVEVERKDGVITLSASNAARYKPYVDALERLDAKQLAGVYLRFYPLFQRAYEELGYPQGYFNDRLVSAIDHLLATPELSGPIELTQPKVLYEFADPKLEALSAGQKAMLRIGPDNARRVKEKLRALRSEVTAKKK